VEVGYRMHMYADVHPEQGIQPDLIEGMVTYLLLGWSTKPSFA
jgi:hypothetical protein